MAKDYYRTLGVEKTASNQEIKRAYRKLAKQYHPDVNQEASADQRFKDIQEAFDVLGDEEKRAQYDQYGSNYERMAGAGTDSQPTMTIFSANSTGVNPDRPDRQGNRLDLKICSGHFLVKNRKKRTKNSN